MSNDKPEPNRPRGRPTIENPATHHIHLRVTPKRKSAYVRAAHPKGLSDWMVENLAKAAAERAPDKKKLESVALAYRAVQLPAMATLHGKTACDRIQRAFAAFIATVESECGTL